MNFRIAREIKGCGDFILRELYENGDFQNTLIVGSPRHWKNNITKRLNKTS